MAQNINFLMPLEGKVATKTFIFKNDEWELSKNYKAGKFFQGFEIPVENLKQAFIFFEQNQNYPVFLIHGGFIDGINKKKMVRRSRDKNKDGKPATLTNRNIHLFCLDIDGYKFPDTGDTSTPPGTNQIEYFIKNNLPDAFHNASYIYQFSASYGLTTHLLKCHIFFWVEEPTYNIDIREWIKAYNKTKNWGNIIDSSVLNPAQPVYTQRRICIGGIDPIDNFIGFVDKDRDLIFDFNNIEIGSKTLIPRQKEDYDLKAGIEQILTAENYHEELNKLALSLINKKVPANTVLELLEGAMNSAENKDKRWQDRYDDIGRAVESASDIVDNPTIEEVLCWIQSEDTLSVKTNFAQKVLRLSPLDRTTAVSLICTKIGYGVADVKKTIKIAEEQDLEKRKKIAKEIKSKERENKGVYEVEAIIGGTGIASKTSCDILAKSKKSPRVFAMGGGLCRVGNGIPSSVRQAAKANDLGVDYPKMPIIIQYNKPYHELAARLEKDIAYVNSEGTDVDCPTRVLHIIGGAEESNFNPLTGIIEHPFIDNNWKLMQKSGYNKRTGLHTTLHHKLKLTKMDAKVAYKYLAEVVLAEFPFASDLDRTVAIAAMMTCIQRPTISGDDGFPGFGIVSPTQSSGKTTLAQLISYAVFNRPVAAANFSDDDEELSKHLLAILQEGHSCVLFDNIKQGTQVASEVLSKVMTSDLFRGRKLGENKTIEVPCSVVWLFTGNGIRFINDFATRVYPININPKMADPNTRTFKRKNIGQWAMDNRKQIISALLSIIIAGEKVTSPKGGSRFKEWDTFIRQPLLAVSGVDINDATEDNQKSDPVAIAKNNLFFELSEAFGDEKFTTKEIITVAFGAFESGDTPLGDAMEELFGDKKAKARSIGMYLNAMIGSVSDDGLCLNKLKAKFAKWYITGKE